MTNLTPIQLEEFESVFRHFDKDLTNTLQELEFSAALASLSLVYDEEEMHGQFESISAGKGYVTFEQFIKFMVSVTEDQNTAEQVFQSFREVADGKVRLGLYIHLLSQYSNNPRTAPAPILHRPFTPFSTSLNQNHPSLSPLLTTNQTNISPHQPYVTELDLRHSLIPDELVEDLLSSMPSHKGPDLQEDRHLPKYDYISFMENMTLGESEKEHGGGDVARRINGHGHL